MENTLDSDSSDGEGDSSQDESVSDIYGTPDFVSEPTVAEPIDSRTPNDDAPVDLSELNSAIKHYTELLAARYDTVLDVLEVKFLDVFPDADDQYENTPYDLRSMANIWVYRLVAPSEGYSTVSWEQLEKRLKDPEFAEALKFDPDNTPSERTLRDHWSDRVRSEFRNHIRYQAAELAVDCENYNVETAENIRESLIEDFRRDTDEVVDPIGKMEYEIKDDAYTVQADIIRDVCSYDRDDSLEWEDDLITDAAANMCRKNEYAQQGIKRMGKDYGLVEERETPSSSRSVG